MSFNRPPALPRDADARTGRPELWAEGSQQPRFDIRAFARVSLILSRRVARPVLIWLAGLMARAARGMANNSLGPWLAQKGRLGRALPTRTTIASGIVGVAALLSAAADVAVPPPPVVMPPAYPDLLRPPAPRPRRAALRLADSPLLDTEPQQAIQPDPAPEPPRAAPDAEFDSETLAVIRAMIAELREPTPVAPRRPDARPAVPAPPLSGRDLLNGHIPLEPPIPRDPTLAERLRAGAFHLAAATVGWTTTGLTLPIGAVKALIVHLKGDDLRSWS